MIFKDFLLVTFIAINISTFDLISTESTINDKTYVTEMIVPFDIPTEDLSEAVSTQLSRNDFRTNNFTTDSVEVSKLIYKTHYNGSNRTVDPRYI